MADTVINPTVPGTRHEAEKATGPGIAGPEPVPTVVVDGVDIVYRVNGTGAGRGTATAALNRILRRKKAEKAAGVRKVHAVRNVSFTAYRGEAIGLIGTNGSGKSTLLKAVAGLLPVENGRIYTDGQPSLLGVNAALMNDLTGERNVHLGGLAMGRHLMPGTALAGERTPAEIRRIAATLR